MSTTLHLLLGDKHPHELVPQCITNGYMLALHRALLKWLLMVTTPSMWLERCLTLDVIPLPADLNTVTQHRHCHPPCSAGLRPALRRGAR
jgi:hypothetical protein